MGRLLLLITSYWKDVIPVYTYDAETNNSKLLTSFHPPCSFEEFKLWFDIVNPEVNMIEFKLPDHYDIYVSREKLETNFEEIERINHYWKNEYD